MKTRYTAIIGCLLLCSASVLFSCRDCDDDHSSESTKSYLLTVKAIDSDYQNIQDNVSLYVFDKAYKLKKVVKCNLDTESNIDVPLNEQYTIVALGHSVDMADPAIPMETLIEDAQIVLSTDVFADKVVATSPGDIFHGTIEIKNEGTECGEVTRSKATTSEDNKGVVWIKRKVAALTIITRNIQSELNTTDEDFSYVVRQTSGTLDFKGNLKGDKVNYHPASHFTTTNRDLVAPLFYTYASDNDDGFCVDIYKGTTLLQSYCTDSDENPMLLKEGKHTVVLIDYRDNSNGGEGFLNVTCKVQDWHDDNIGEEFE